MGREGVKPVLYNFKGEGLRNCYIMYGEGGVKN